MFNSKTLLAVRKDFDRMRAKLDQTDDRVYSIMSTVSRLEAQVAQLKTTEQPAPVLQLLDVSESGVTLKANEQVVHLERPTNQYR